MEIRLQLVALWFVNLVYLFLRQNYVINAFVPYAFWHIFHDDRITFYLGMFELRIEERLQLRFGFVRYCDAFSITSQLHYSFVRCSYVFLMALELLLFWYVRITYGSYVIKWSFLVTSCFNQKTIKKYVIIA